MPTTYAIPNGRTVMDASLYTGNNTTNVITNTAGFKPDLVWIKGRSNATVGVLQNSVTGVNRYLIPSSTGAEGTDGSVTSFNTNGFSLTTDAGNAYNYNGYTYDAWQWQAGQGTTSSNTNGSQTSTVSVNATAGFSVVTFTMQASGVGTVGHGLGVAPQMIIMKARTGAIGWGVYHQSIGNGSYLVMNMTQAAQADANAWNNTSPTSSVWTIGSSFAGLGTYVAYCWAPVAGFSQFGSFTGNGNADNAFIYTGFRPKFIMIKSTGTDSWYMYDSSRNPSNVVNLLLQANLSDAEATATAFDFLSNGIKFRSAGWSGTYVYMAFAENPFKYANAR